MSVRHLKSTSSDPFPHFAQDVGFGTSSLFILDDPSFARSQMLPLSKKYLLAALEEPDRAFPKERPAWREH